MVDGSTGIWVRPVYGENMRKKAIDPVRPTETDDYICTPNYTPYRQYVYRFVSYEGQYLAPKVWQFHEEECVGHRSEDTTRMDL